MAYDSTSLRIDFLQRLIAMLFSLAAIAAKASRRSRWVRRRVIAALRPAEAAAFGSVVNAARHFGAPVPVIANIAYSDWMAATNGGDDADDALRLAGRLQALALALSYIAAWADCFARRLTAPGRTPWRGWQHTPAGLAARQDAFGNLNDLASRTRAPP